jgi:ribosomal protein S18 acetylase RimI-like enzyme
VATASAPPDQPPALKVYLLNISEMQSLTDAEGKDPTVDFGDLLLEGRMAPTQVHGDPTSTKAAAATTGGQDKHETPASERSKVYKAIEIRAARTEDAPAIWAIIEPIIRAGETYTLPRDMTQKEAIAYWMGPDGETFVAEEDGRLFGTYFLRPNQLGGGAHVANCGYITAVEATGRGIARMMCIHSLERAQDLGFRAMQFNFVVSTNERAVRLWQRFGFEIVGTLPRAFAHPKLGDVDALVMFKTL